MDNSWLLKDPSWSTMTDCAKYENVSKRMDSIFAYSERKKWRKRYASPEQFADEYSEEREKAVIASFVFLKEEYQEIREYALANHKDKVNVIVMEKILEDDAERILLGSDDD